MIGGFPWFYPHRLDPTGVSQDWFPSSSEFSSQFQQPGLQGLAELGYPDHWNLLMTALESRQCPEMSPVHDGPFGGR